MKKKHPFRAATMKVKEDAVRALGERFCLAIRMMRLITSKW